MSSGMEKEKVIINNNNSSKFQSLEHSDSHISDTTLQHPIAVTPDKADAMKLSDDVMEGTSGGESSAMSPPAPRFGSTGRSQDYQRRKQHVIENLDDSDDESPRIAPTLDQQRKQELHLPPSRVASTFNPNNSEHLPAITEETSNTSIENDEGMISQMHKMFTDLEQTKSFSYNTGGFTDVSDVGVLHRTKSNEEKRSLVKPEFSMDATRAHSLNAERVFNTEDSLRGISVTKSLSIDTDTYSPSAASEFAQLSKSSSAYLGSAKSRRSLTNLERRTSFIDNAMKEAERLKSLELLRRSPVITISNIPRERMNQIKQVLREAIPKVARERAHQIDKNVAHAKLCILDAFQGRLSNGLATNSKKGPYIYTIFTMQTSDWLFKAVIYSCVLHTCSIFFEPENACSNSWYSRLFQVAVVLVYSFDIVLKVAYEGFPTYWDKDWQRLYLIVTAINIADLLFNGCTYYANPLRPVPGVLRARNGRRFFDILKKMIPGTSSSIVPIIFFIMLMLVIGGIFFDEHVALLKEAYQSFYNWFFLIFTNDTFPRILPDNTHKSVGYLLFFLPSIYIGQKFLLSLVIGDTYETFRSFVKKQIAKERLKEMQGLTKAFSVLDDQKTGIISSNVWRSMLAKFRPDLSPEAVALYYELISGGSNDGVSILQFLNLKSVLQFNLTMTNTPHNVVTNKLSDWYKRFVKRYRAYYLHCPTSWPEYATKVLAWVEKKELIPYLNSADLLFLLFELYDRQIISVPLVLVHSSLLITVDTIVNMAYLVEFYIRLIAHTGNVAAVHRNNNTVANLFVLGVIGRCVCTFVGMWGWSETTTLFLIPMYYLPFTVDKLLLLLRGMRCFRMVNLNEDLHNFNAAVVDVMPVLLETMTFTIIVTYIFGLAGNLLFGQYIESWATPMQGFVTAQQLSYMFNFLDSMEEVTAKVHPAAALFFVFYLILSLAVSNIALSIIIDLHANTLDAKSNKERDGQKRKVDIVFDQIVNRARSRVMFRKNNRVLNFKNIQMSQFQSSDTRHFLTNAQDEPMKLEDIKACQKYAKGVELIKMYNSAQNRSKSINWEVDFIKSCHDNLCYREVQFARGDIIYEVGDLADKFYLLLTGSVMLFGEESSKGIIHASNFIGAECLQPHSWYDMTCMAESDTSCLQFFTDDLMQNMDEEMCGKVVKMMHRSCKLIHDAFQYDQKMRNVMPALQRPRVPPDSNATGAGHASPRAKSTNENHGKQKAMNAELIKFHLNENQNHQQQQPKS